MKAQYSPNKALSGLIAMVLVAGCATTKETQEEQFVTGKIARPAHIWVFNFAATPDEVPPGSVLAQQAAMAPMSQTPQQIAEGRKLGAEIATELVAEIVSMGMPAGTATASTRMQTNDIIIEGYLLSVQQGNEAERVGIGFGEGASALKVAVEGFEMTPTGMRPLGAGDLDATGGKSPGESLGVASLLITHNPVGLIINTGAQVYEEKSGSAKVEGRAKQIAKDIGGQLKIKFQQQGWIAPGSS